MFSVALGIAIVVLIYVATAAYDDLRHAGTDRDYAIDSLLFLYNCATIGLAFGVLATHG